MAKFTGKVVDLSPQGFGRIVFDAKQPAVFFSFDRVEGFNGLRHDRNGALVVGSIRQGSKVAFDAQTDAPGDVMMATAVMPLKP